MSLTSRIAIEVTALLTGSADLGNPSAPLDYDASVALGDGTGADQADLIFHDQRTIAASDTEDLDLAGVLTDALGNTLNFARVKAILIVAASGNTNDVQVTQPGASGVPLFLNAGEGIAVRPGGIFAWACRDATGVVVTAGTGDLITVTNSAGGTPVTYDVIIIGASA